MAIEFIAYYSLLGIFVGFMAGLLGVGGGGIMVPIFTTLFVMQGFDDASIVHLALGTSMASIVFTSFASLRAHYRNGNVSSEYIKRMAWGLIIGTFGATYLVSLINGLYLALFFTLFFTYNAISMFFDKKSSEKSLHTPTQNTLVGLLVGAISALVSVGGGAMNVPYLLSQRLEMKRAVGTSAAFGFPIAFAGLIGYLINGWDNTNLDQLILGYVYLPAVVIIALTSYFMAPIGANYANRIPTKQLKKLFSLLLIVLSIKMILTVL
jgi:uncharacterized membrane protein YfcA